MNDIPLLLEVTGLPTKPQPLPIFSCLLVQYGDQLNSLIVLWDEAQWTLCTSMIVLMLTKARSLLNSILLGCCYNGLAFCFIGNHSGMVLPSLHLQVTLPFTLTPVLYPLSFSKLKLDFDNFYFVTPTLFISIGWSITKNMGRQDGFKLNGRLPMLDVFL